MFQCKQKTFWILQLDVREYISISARNPCSSCGIVPSAISTSPLPFTFNSTWRRRGSQYICSIACVVLEIQFFKSCISCSISLRHLWRQVLTKFISSSVTVRGAGGAGISREECGEVNGPFITSELGRASSGEEKVLSASREQLSGFELEKTKDGTHFVISKMQVGVGMVAETGNLIPWEANTGLLWLFLWLWDHPGIAKGLFQKKKKVQLDPN